MRELINSTYITLDGVIQNPQDWPSLGSFSERGDEIQTDLLLSCDLQIMGRKTYEAFAPAWPTRSGDPLSDRMNAMPKYVFSTRVTDPAWENTTHPFFVGHGGAEALVYSEGSKARLKLAESVTLESGIVILTYRA
jgi:dihydrofolate reductase